MDVAYNGSVQVMGEWAVCDIKMANFRSNLRRPPILPHMLCALIRHIAGLLSSHFRPNISSKKQQEGRSTEKHQHRLCYKEYIDVENPVSNVAVSLVIVRQLPQPCLQRPNAQRQTLQQPKGIQHRTVQQKACHRLYTCL